MNTSKNEYFSTIVQKNNCGTGVLRHNHEQYKYRNITEPGNPFLGHPVITTDIQSVHPCIIVLDQYQKYKFGVVAKYGTQTITVF